MRPIFKLIFLPDIQCQGTATGASGDLSFWPFLTYFGYFFILAPNGKTKAGSQYKTLRAFVIWCWISNILLNGALRMAKRQY